MKTRKDRTKYIDHPLNKSKTKSTFHFTKSSRFYQQKSYSPNKFYQVVQRTKGKSFSLGSGNKTNFAKIDTLEPAKYHIVSEFDKLNKQKGFSFGIGRKQYYKGLSTTNLVGPGKYNINDQNVTTKKFYIGQKIQPVLRFSKADTYNYELKSQIMNKLSTHQNSQKCLRIKTQYFEKTPLQFYNNKVPGPGTYNILDGIEVKKCSVYETGFGKQQRLKTISNFPNIGPAKQCFLNSELTERFGAAIILQFELIFDKLKYITNMYEYEDDDEEVKDPDAGLPQYKIRHNDMKIQLVKLIVRKVDQIIQSQKKRPEQLLEKDICLKLVEYLRSNKVDFGAGEGQWQCIIGKHLSATLNYDLHMLSFFDLPEFGLSILVFKSG